MRMIDFLRKSILPIALATLLLWIGKGFYLQDEGINLFDLWMLLGIPMGIPYMFVVIPTRWDLSGTLGIVLFSVIIGGLLGGVIAMFLLIRATIILVWFPFSLLIAHLSH